MCTATPAAHADVAGLRCAARGIDAVPAHVGDVGQPRRGDRSAELRQLSHVGIATGQVLQPRGQADRAVGETALDGGTHGRELSGSAGLAAPPIAV